MTTHFFADTAVLQGRSLRHIMRSPDTIITTTIMPIAFMLLFVFVFGGAINSGSDSYVNYLLPGILLITIASGVSYTAFRLFNDMQSGIVERFQSMPIARSAVLWAHVGTSLVANLISLVVVVLGSSVTVPAGLPSLLARLRDVCALVVLLTHEDAELSCPAVRTTVLDDGDPLRQDAAVVLLSPERALALHARRLPGGGWSRRRTADPHEVGESARMLLTRAAAVERHSVLALG